MNIDDFNISYVLSRHGNEQIVVEDQHIYRKKKISETAHHDGLFNITWIFLDRNSPRRCRSLREDTPVSVDLSVIEEGQVIHFCIYFFLTSNLSRS